MTSPDIQADVIIIGSGLMGASTALALCGHGKSVLILEKETAPCHASAVNAGGVRRLNRALEEIPISLAAMEMWPRLEDLLGASCGFEPVGQVRIAPDAPAMEVFETRHAMLNQKGFFHEELVSPDDIRRQVPAYAGDCAGGLVCRDDGHALPAATLKAFLNAAQRVGARIVTHCRVTSMIRGENGFCVTAQDGRSFQSETVVNCTGAWGSRIAAMAGDILPMEPAGLSMMVTARMPRFITPVVGVHGRKLSFKQMANGTVVIGGAHRARLDMQSETTAIDFSQMRQSALTVKTFFPVMKHASIVRCWAGIEGIMPDGLPVIGASLTTPGLFHVCGFSAHGFQLSPMIGRLADALVMGRTPELSLEAFSLSRFKGKAP